MLRLRFGVLCVPKHEILTDLRSVGETVLEPVFFPVQPFHQVRTLAGAQTFQAAAAITFTPFGNIQADGSGKAHLDMMFDNITISGSKNPIVGHALIVHEKEDDGSQPTGNAGARIGCGIIKAGGK